MEIQINKNTTLEEVIYLMSSLNSLGFETHFSGLGNKKVKLVIQDKI